jgi:hypothetical protein
MIRIYISFSFVINRLKKFEEVTIRQEESCHHVILLIEQHNNKSIHNLISLRFDLNHK